MNKLIFLLLVFTIISCQKNPHEINDEELITSLIYKLKSTSDDDEVVLTFSDLDGNGGNAPIITTTGFLQKGKMYEGTINILNQSLNPFKDLTLEIEKEGLDHQFFYILNPSLSSQLFIEYADSDSENNPLGLQTRVSASMEGSGQLRIVLRHMPNKQGLGVSDGLLANAGGDTDIDVTFDLDIK